MKRNKKIIVILIPALLIFLDEMCKQIPENYYCRCLETYTRYPEPITVSNLESINFSYPYGIGVSGATTTVSSTGTILNPTTTTL